MSWMKRRGQPSPSPANPGVQMYNPNQHSNPQQSYQQWPQQNVPQQQYNNDWYNQSRNSNKTPPTQPYAQSNTNNYWQASYNQPQQNLNTNAPNQPVPTNQYQQPQYNQYPNHQPTNYYQNTGYGQGNYAQQNYPAQNYYPGQQNVPNNVPNSNFPQNNSPGLIGQSSSPGLVGQVSASPGLAGQVSSSPGLAGQVSTNTGLTNQVSSTSGLASQITAQPSEADPWNWGWDDNTNSNSQPQTEIANQNNITESFANDESWNWTVDDSSSSHSGANQNPNNEMAPKVENTPEINNSTSHNVTDTQETSHKDNENADTVDCSQANTGISDFYSRNSTHQDTLEELPNIRRLKNDNLTPQWSIESQVSQDSSEDVLLTSESDNRSNILSQSSTTSQSASTHDLINDYGPPVYKYESECMPTEPPELRMSRQEPVNSEYYQENAQSRIDSVDKALQELSLNAQFENKEIVSPEVAQSVNEPVQQPIKEPTPPPPLAKKLTPPLLPPGQTSTDANKNPYKRSTGISHKSANKILAAKESTSQASIESSNVQNVFLQNTNTFTQAGPSRPADNMGVNLETLPDNSERPDQPVENMQKTVRKTSTVQQQWAENCEIAPINDRNQYLETGQLSDADLPVYNQSGDDYQLENTQGASADTGDSLPPPGLRRLVLGQMEQSDNNQPVDNSQDEPPPGLSRMVLGSTEMEPNNQAKQTRGMYTRVASIQANVFHPPDYQTNEPPAGLRRMVPGESSSPESSTYVRTSLMFVPPSYDDADNYVSESELNQMGVSLVSQRSATIGADTPPASNQQTVSNTGYSSSSSVDPIPSREGAVGIDSEHRETDLASANTIDENVSSIPSDTNRRETIDGGPQEEISAVRDQTVGQNTTDITTSNASSQDKHRNRTYSDSDHENSKERHPRNSSPGRYDKSGRYYDDRRERRRDRDSPDRYRDKKYDRKRPKDRKYEDDTDYYSDKERNERRLRDEREEYERRFHSLRKDKDKRRGDRREYDRDDRRGDYYHNRYDDDYYNREPNRSRPSSRSDSMHDSYRERNRPQDLDRTRHRDRERDHRRPRDPRDPYNSYYQGYNYDPYSSYYQQYQYYENLRRTNPAAYAEWYRKYYQNQAGTAYTTEDRASVHSGRSSANDEHKDRYTRQSYYSQQSIPHYYRDNYRDVANASTVYTADDSRLLDHTNASMILEDTTIASQRLTPAKFSTAHVKASISSGQFINILPHYPLDGQPAILEIIDFQSLLADNEDLKELSEFPGPLVKGVTHKKTVIDYCENKIKRAQNSNIQDVQSYILMWELLILLLRQNGMVVGTDIAELLMKNRPIETSRRQSVSSTSSTQHLDTVGEANEHGARVSPAMHYKEEYITDKFREYLIYGSGKEALEWAMKHGLWGHALFLASKLDKRTYANVMMRFANGLTMNDPLQTLYQLLSGRQPASVTSVADEKWGDWRPHLAMILSNTSQRPDLDRKAITTLGDTLQSRGNLYAAHFCYLMAQVEFGRYGSHNAKLVLLASSHQKPFETFATNEAIFMTEIYEYACSLSDANLFIPEFQPYKYLLATRMVDHGLVEKALLYLERVAEGIKRDPSHAQHGMVARVCQLADRLKYCDPAQVEADIDSTAQSSWITELKLILDDYNMGLITHQSSNNLSLEPELQQHMKPVIDQQQVNEQQWQQQQSTEYYQQGATEQQQVWQPDQQNVDYNQQQQQQMNYQEDMSLQQQSYDANTTQYQEQQYWNQQQQQQTWDENNESTQQNSEDQPQSDYWNTAHVEEQPRPQISMPNQSKTKSPYDEDDTDNQSSAKSATPAKPKAPTSQNKPASTGWFGGIWSKLALRPKNQMKLPDDKNPTIVWDSEKKRWVNLEEDNGDASNEIKPPPKMSDMFPKRAPPSGPTSLPTMPTQNQNFPSSAPPMMQSTDHAPMSLGANSAGPPSIDNLNTKEEGPKPPAQPNMFKLGQRGRNIKKAYVDVFNPGGVKASTNSSVAASEIFGSVSASGGGQMNYFVPAPVADPNAPTDFLTPATAATEDQPQSGGAPMMFNPSQFSNQAPNNAPIGMYQPH